MNFIPFEVKNIMSDSENYEIIKILTNQASWKMSCDYEDVNDSIYSDTGFLLKSYSINQTKYLNAHNANINSIAYQIMMTIFNNIAPIYFSGVDVNRYLWNYYNKSSTGIFHVDMMTQNPDDKFASIVYYLNTCDGGTELEIDEYNKISIPSISGNAVVFDSSIRHRGITVKNDPRRFVLNIVFKYDELIGIS